MERSVGSGYVVCVDQCSGESELYEGTMLFD